jgi:galactokinase
MLSTMEVRSPRALDANIIAYEPRFAAHLAEFEQRFGVQPASMGSPRMFFAPGRINLMGAHLDYNGGPVMPMAIDRGTFLILRPRMDGTVRIATSMDTKEVQLDLATLFGTTDKRSDGSWWDYSVGVLLALGASSDTGLDPTAGFDLYYGGDLPIGAGLSSSASVSLVTAVALNAHFALQLSVEEAIDAALWSERQYVGVMCGIMDPFAVGFAQPGSVLLLDCRDRSWEHVTIDADKYMVGIIDTTVRRELAKGEFNLRVSQCTAAYDALAPHATDANHLAEISMEVFEQQEASLDPVVAKRARHVIEETSRTFEARDALKLGDVTAFGCAMFDAHDSLRDLYDVSIDELNTIVDFARAHDAVLGARLTGAGFGGCVAVIMRAGFEHEFGAAVRADFMAKHKVEPRVAFYKGSPGLGEVSLS